MSQRKVPRLVEDKRSLDIVRIRMEDILGTGEEVLVTAKGNMLPLPVADTWDSRRGSLG